jgi:hypothetical protein
MKAENYLQSICRFGTRVCRAPNAKAVEVLKSGLAKGSVTDKDYAQAVLGVAQISVGQKSEALKTFRSTTSDGEVTESLLKLWALYAS